MWYRAARHESQEFEEVSLDSDWLKPVMRSMGSPPSPKSTWLALFEITPSANLSAPLHSSNEPTSCQYSHVEGTSLSDRFLNTSLCNVFILLVVNCRGLVTHSRSEG